MTNIKISIIIATYNADKTLSEALNSVLNQSFQDWECIIVDGMSKDNTINIIQTFHKKDSRFRYISEQDKGIYDAFNKGWKMANGEWIYYLGADDKLALNGLTDLIYQAGDLSQWDIIYGNVLHINSIGKTKISKCCNHNVLPNKGFASHQGIIMRKKLIEQLGGFDENLKILADKDLFIRTYKLGNCKYKKTNALVAIFYTGGSSCGIKKNLSENWYIFKKNSLGPLFLLYIIQIYTRKYIKYLLNKINIY